jgi:hypothetical protein
MNIHDAKRSRKKAPTSLIGTPMSGERSLEIEITPAMTEAGALRLADIGEASSAYLAEEAFRAMIEVALREGVLCCREQTP